MRKITVAIRADLTKEAATDINLAVHRHYIGQPSPCMVVKDSERWGVGGHIETINEIFDEEVGKCLGYAVQRRLAVEFETADGE